MVMHSHLNRLLLVGVFCFLSLGLPGCSGGVKARLDILAVVGGRKTPCESPISETIVSDTSKNQKEAQVGGNEAKDTCSIADTFVGVVGAIGELSFGACGAVFGGGIGAIGGGGCAAYQGKYIPSGIADGASGGAHFLSSVAAPVGGYTFRMTARGLVWAAPYAFNGLRWVAINAYNGMTYVASTVYDGAVNVAGYSLHQGSDSKIVDPNHDDEDAQFLCPEAA